MRNAVQAAVSILIAMACTATPAQGVGVSPSTAWKPVLMWRLEMPTNWSGFSDPAKLVITDQSEFNRVWAQALENTEPVPAPPEIDFSQEAVIVVALGQRGSGGYTIRIAGAHYTQASLEVVVQTHAPGQGCGVTLAFTSPVDIVRIPIPRKPVIFRAHERTTDCK